MKVWVITEQLENGAWEVTGEAFGRKSTAEDRVNKLTRRALAKHAKDEDLDKLLGLGDPSLVRTLRSEGKLAAALEEADEDCLYDAAEDIQLGGLYSIEGVSVKDAEWVK